MTQNHEIRVLVIDDDFFARSDLVGRLAARLVYPPTGETTTYLRCFELQTRQVARYMLGQQGSYGPLPAR